MRLAGAPLLASLALAAVTGCYQYTGPFVTDVRPTADGRAIIVQKCLLVTGTNNHYAGVARCKNERFPVAALGVNGDG